MGIELKYSASPAVLAAAGVAAGKNKREAQMAQTFMPIVRQQMQNRWEEQVRQQQYGHDFQRMQYRAQLDRERLERGYQHSLDLANLQWERQGQRDALQWERQQERDRALAGYRAQGEFEQQIAAGLRSGKLRYTPEQQRKIAQWQDAIFAVQEDETLDDEQKAAAIGELQARIRRVVPMAVPEDQQPVPIEEALRSKVANYERYKHLPWVLNEKGEPQLPRGWKPEEPQKPGREDISNPVNYHEAYTRMWKQIVSEREFEQKQIAASRPVDDETPLKPVQAPTRFEVNERLRQMGYRFSPEQEIADLEEEARAIRSRADRFEQLSPDDQRRLRELSMRARALHQANQAAGGGLQVPAPQMQLRPPVGVAPMSPEEQQFYEAQQRAARDPRVVQGFVGELPPEAAGQLGPQGRMRPANFFTPEQEIAMLQAEIDKIEADERAGYRDGFYLGDRKAELRKRIDRIRREQAGQLRPSDVMEFM